MPGATAPRRWPSCGRFALPPNVWQAAQRRRTTRCRSPCPTLASPTTPTLPLCTRGRHPSPPPTTRPRLRSRCSTASLPRLPLPLPKRQTAPSHPPPSRSASATLATPEPFRRTRAFSASLPASRSGPRHSWRNRWSVPRRLSRCRCRCATPRRSLRSLQRRRSALPPRPCRTCGRRLQRPPSLSPRHRTSPSPPRRCRCPRRSLRPSRVPCGAPSRSPRWPSPCPCADRQRQPRT
mmetsp:Transcript_1259/g.3921  ORF Transcript_1259/g.3921 Transcript_1259/m.3921 type:complete len:236 (+) Transcript_1259:1085-1792(+)